VGDVDPATRAAIDGRLGSIDGLAGMIGQAHDLRGLSGQRGVPSDVERVARETAEAIAELEGTERTVDLRAGRTEDGAPYVKGKDEPLGRWLLKRIARMRRDGWSLRRIRYEIDLHPSVSDAVLERALAQGERLLSRDIAVGTEPAESVHRIRVPE
jgi:hypothetical protein